MFESALSRRLLASAAILTVILAAACSSDKSTGPPGGGGGTTKELNSPNLLRFATYVDTLPMTAGTFPYHCKFHGVMTASVIVSAGGAATAAVGISDNAFGPNLVTVSPGGIVTWTNNGSNTHTVTSD
jgi:plastocyanin